MIEESKKGMAVIFTIFLVIHVMDFIALQLFQDKIKMKFSEKNEGFLEWNKCVDEPSQIKFDAGSDRLQSALD